MGVLSLRKTWRSLTTLIANARTGSCCHSNRSRPEAPPPSHAPIHPLGLQRSLRACRALGRGPGPPLSAACSSSSLKLPPNLGGTRPSFFQVHPVDFASEQHSSLLSSREFCKLPSSHLVFLASAAFSALCPWVGLTVPAVGASTAPSRGLRSLLIRFCTQAAPRTLLSSPTILKSGSNHYRKPQPLGLKTGPSHVGL